VSVAGDDVILFNGRVAGVNGNVGGSGNNSGGRKKKKKIPTARRHAAPHPSGVTWWSLVMTLQHMCGGAFGGGILSHH